MTKETCNTCSAPCEGITCDPCFKAGLEELLSSQAWLEVRGVTQGDKPGQTLMETIQEELQRLNNV